MEDTVRVRCLYCREWVEFYVDPESVGQLVEDCAVCCQPWAVTIERGGGTLRVQRDDRCTENQVFATEAAMGAERAGHAVFIDAPSHVGRGSHVIKLELIHGKIGTPMTSTFEVESEFELLALYRVLFEAKFSAAPEDQDIAASRMVADMAVRIAKALGATRDSWRAWLVLDPTRREWRNSVLHAVSLRDWWRAATTEERVGYIETLLAPFPLDEALVARFADEVEATLAEGRWFATWRTMKKGSLRIVTERPDMIRPQEIVVIAEDGATVLYRSESEFEVTEWLSENMFEFMGQGLIPK